eukprot:2239486-Rhodomonas_salina.2
MSGADEGYAATRRRRAPVCRFPEPSGASHVVLTPRQTPLASYALPMQCPRLIQARWFQRVSPRSKSSYPTSLSAPKRFRSWLRDQVTFSPSYSDARY